MRNWLKDIEQYGEKNVCKVLVGNKRYRQDRKVSFEEAFELAMDFNMKYFETSAKTNQNITETFTFLTKEILNTTGIPKTKNSLIKDNKIESEKNSYCDYIV